MVLYALWRWLNSRLISRSSWVSVSTKIDGPICNESEGRSGKQVQLTAMAVRHQGLVNAIAGVTVA